MRKYFIGLLLIIGATTAFAGKLQNSDHATSAEITGAGGANSQLLNTSKIWDNVNAQLLNTTLASFTSGGITALTGDVTATGPGSVAATIANNAVSDAKLRDSSALSVIGRSVNSVGDPADIVAGADFNILRRSGVTIGFGAIDLSQAGAVGASILANANTTATSTNTASAIVARDGSGNFSAGTITAALTGNSSTATALAANPTDCGADSFATTIAANGDLTCTSLAPATSAIGASDIDWSLVKTNGGLFTKTLGANTTFTFSNRTAGQTIIVRLTNTASNYTVTWPTVKWAGGAAPVMTVGAKSDVYTFVYDGTDVFGSYVQNMF